jgi:hypothetical protein
MLRLDVWTLLLASAVHTAPAVPPGTEAWYTAHVFEGMEGCLAVRAGQRLKVGDQVLLFASGKPRMAGISALHPADSLRRVFETKGFQGVYADRKLWPEIGCYWALGMRGMPAPLAMAKCDTSVSLEDELPLAFQALPAAAVVLGGAGDTLSKSELDSLAARVSDSVPPAFAREPALRFGRRYRSGVHEVTEMFIGRASYRRGSASIDSMDICRLFLTQGRVLALQRISRATGRMEHVDVEAPDLDESNWFAISEQTLGFLSLDGGTTWDHLSVDVGFEGIQWTIRRLAEGTPTRWEFYLYTSH